MQVAALCLTGWVRGGRLPGAAPGCVRLALEEAGRGMLRAALVGCAVRRAARVAGRGCLGRSAADLVVKVQAACKPVQAACPACSWRRCTRNAQLRRSSLPCRQFNFLHAARSARKPWCNRTLPATTDFVPVWVVLTALPASRGARGFRSFGKSKERNFSVSDP